MYLLKIQNIIEKKTDLKERLELISKYSNNSLVRNLSVPEKLFLYETKRIFDIHYFNTKPAHALFLDTKFKIKYICDTEFSREERNLDVEKIVEIMKEKNIVAEEVYELENSEEQIRFELFKVIQNNFVINKCENCGRLFIPATTNNNPYQKARNEQKYCNNLYLDTGKTCKEIGATNKHKEKVEDSYQEEKNESHLINLEDAENQEIKNISIILAAGILIPTKAAKVFNAYIKDINIGIYFSIIRSNLYCLLLRHFASTSIFLFLYSCCRRHWFCSSCSFYHNFYLI